MRPDYPPKNDVNKTRHFLDTVMSHENPYWLDQYSIWEKARLYVKRNQQWLEPDQMEDATHSPFWKLREVDGDNWTPMPVHNEMIAQIQNEAARLQGNGSRPYIRPVDDTPKMQRAAKLGRDVLVSKLEELYWRELEHEGCDELATYGNWIFKAWWDIDYTKTVRVPVTDALKCPSCDFRMANAKVPEKKTAAVMTAPKNEGRISVESTEDENNPLVPPKFRAKATHCLTCQPTAPTMDEFGAEIAPGAPPPPLEAYTPESEEAQEGRDYFGRPLGEEVPLGDVNVQNISCFNYKPENFGNTRLRDLSEHGEERIETLDWVANHYPDKAKDVKAEDAADLMRWHPIVGNSRYLYGGGDVGMFANHVLVREWHKEPWIEVDKNSGRWKLNRGRSLIMAGNVVLLDGDFMIEKEDGSLLARVHYEVVPWEIRTGEVWGLSMSEILFSQQESINTLISQVQDARHRFGSPKLLCEEGMDLNYSGYADTGYNSDIWYYRPGATEDAKPIPFGNQQMEGQWVAEYQHYVDSMQRSAGTMDAETGAVPGGGSSEWSAQALMYLGEKASERRKNRIDRIREAKKRMYRFMLEWIQERYVEDRNYTIKTESERLSVRAFTGADLEGNTDVEIDDEPAYDTKVVRRAAIGDGLKAGTIVADTATARRKINRELGAPLDINEDQNKQVERACDEALAYYEDGLAPAVDIRADDHTIHFQQHMLDLMGDDWQRLRDDVDWNQVQLAIWNWQEDFDVLMSAEAELKANPLPPQPPMPLPDPVTGKVAPEAVAAEQQQWQQRQQTAQIIAAMPRALELRIFQFMQKTLEQSGILQNQAPDPMTGAVAVQVDTERMGKINQLFRFYAHAEAHYRQSQAQAQAAAPGPAAPGGMETPRGMAPTQGEPAQPGAGSGPGATTTAGSGPPA